MKKAIVLLLCVVFLAVGIAGCKPTSDGPGKSTGDGQGESAGSNSATATTAGTGEGSSMGVATTTANGTGPQQSGGTTNSTKSGAVTTTTNGKSSGDGKSDVSGRVTNLNGRVIRYQVPGWDKTSASYKRTVENINAIEKQLNCKIEMVALAGESGNNTNITLSVISGKPLVDLWIQNGTSDFLPHYQNGLLQNLTDLHIFDFKSVDWDPCMDMMTYKGKAYAVRKRDSGNITWYTMILLFNNKLINDYIPQYAGKIDQWQKSGEWTWEKFEEVCKAFNKAVGTNSNFTACFDQTGAAYLSMLATNKTDWVKVGANNKFTFNGSDKKAQAAMNMFKNYVSNGTIICEKAPGAKLNFSSNMIGKDNKYSFIAGQALFAFNTVEGLYWNVFQSPETADTVRKNIGAAPIPKMAAKDEYTNMLPVNSVGYGIPVGVTKPEEVATVLNLLEVEPLVNISAKEKRAEWYAENIEPYINSKTSGLTENTVMGIYDSVSSGKWFAMNSSAAIYASTDIWSDGKMGWIGRYLYEISHGDIAQSAALATVTSNYNKILASLTTTAR